MSRTVTEDDQVEVLPILPSLNIAETRDFYHDYLGFTEIVPTVQAVLSRHDVPSEVTVEDILAADAWARETARQLIEGSL